MMEQLYYQIGFLISLIITFIIIQYYRLSVIIQERENLKLDPDQEGIDYSMKSIHSSIPMTGQKQIKILLLGNCYINPQSFDSIPYNLSRLFRANLDYLPTKKTIISDFQDKIRTNSNQLAFDTYDLVFLYLEDDFNREIISEKKRLRDLNDLIFILDSRRFAGKVVIIYSFQEKSDDPFPFNYYTNFQRNKFNYLEKQINKRYQKIIFHNYNNQSESLRDKIYNILPDIRV